MATDDQIMQAAGELGQMLGEHPNVSRLESAIAKLKSDTEAQRALNDFNRRLHTIAEKEMAGQPIEVSEKRQLQELQNAVVHNLVLREFQLAQMDYADLVRKIDDQMYGRSAAAASVGVVQPGDRSAETSSPLSGADLPVG